MKKIVFLLASIIQLSFYPINAFAELFSLSENFGRCDWHPYVGADFQVRYMDFQEGFGENTLEHSSPQGSGYAGIKMNEFTALEGGFDSTGTRTRISTVSAGEMAAGAVIPAAMSPTVFKSKIKIQGLHFDILGLYPIYDCQGCPIEVFGSIGAAFLKGTSERQTLSVAGVTGSLRVRTLVDKKTVLRLTMGLQYQLGNHLGIRGTVGWLNTARLIIYSNDGLASMYTPEVKPRNSTFCGFGLYWAF